MDTNSPNENDLSDLEHRLSDWRPSTEGLSREAMLFAAGLESGRAKRRRVLWPALTTVLAISTATLGAWGLKERAECQLLLSRLHETREPTSPTSASSINAFVAASHSAGVTSPDSYFKLRRQLEQDPGLRLASRESTGPIRIGAAPPESAILRASEYEALFNQ